MCKVENYTIEIRWWFDTICKWNKKFLRLYMIVSSSSLNLKVLLLIPPTTQYTLGGKYCESTINHQYLRFHNENLHIRYFGVPLSYKRLLIVQCQPLLERMLGRVTTWTTKFLSYAGRVQLIKCVLFFIQTFWSQVFILPKKIVELIEAIHKRYIWRRNTEVIRKALIAWDKLYYPCQHKN